MEVYLMKTTAKQLLKLMLAVQPGMKVMSTEGKKLCMGGSTWSMILELAVEQFHICLHNSFIKRLLRVLFNDPYDNKIEVRVNKGSQIEVHGWLEYDVMYITFNTVGG